MALLLWATPLLADCLIRRLAKPWRSVILEAMGTVLLATVLFADLVGSTAEAAPGTHQGSTEPLWRYRSLIGAQIGEFGGEGLAWTDEGLSASFAAPGQAVRCAACLLEATRQLGLSIRAGVHTGECERIDGTLSGMTVHIGDQICTRAQPGEVLVSSTVRDLLAGSDLTFIDAGLRALKGIPGDWHVYSLDTGDRSARVPVRVQLCGRLAIEIGQRRVDDALPGRQGRMLFTYLAVNRRRPVGRYELVDALWSEDPPADADTSLSALLSKLRRMLGPGRLDGRGTLQLQLPEGSWIDVEAAMEAIHRAEAALNRRDWAEAWSAARVSLYIARRPFLAGEESIWIEEARNELSEVHVRSLEVTARAGLAIGGSELDTAERSARALMREAPYRESGYRSLMEVQAKKGNVAEALHTYEMLRRRLQDELGVSPSSPTQDLYAQLLQ